MIDAAREGNGEGVREDGLGCVWAPRRLRNHTPIVSSGKHPVWQWVVLNTSQPGASDEPAVNVGFASRLFSGAWRGASHEKAGRCAAFRVVTTRNVWCTVPATSSVRVTADEFLPGVPHGFCKHTSTAWIHWMTYKGKSHVGY